MPTLLSTYSKDFTRLQQQKVHMRGSIETRVLTALCFYYGEHYVTATAKALIQPPTNPNKLSLIFNLARKAVRQKIGRLTAGHPEFPAVPDSYDPRAFAKAEVVTKLIKSLDRTVDQFARTWEILFWAAIGGVAVEYIPWDPDVKREPLPQFDDASGELLWLDTATDTPILQSEVDRLVTQEGRAPESFTVVEELRTVGEVGSEILSPFNIFVDASVRDLQKLTGDQAVYVAEIKTLGWIKDNFDAEKATAAKGGDLTIVQTNLKQQGPVLGGANLRDLLPAVQGTQGPDDPEMALVVTRYQMPAKGKFAATGRETRFVPSQVILSDGPNPYEKIPLVDYHWEPAATSFWTDGMLTDLIPANKFLNKRMSQLGEQANASIYDILLLGPDLAREDVSADKPTTVEGGVNEQGVPLIHRVAGPQLPGWFLESIKIVTEFLQEVGGSTLLQQRKGMGQLRGSLGVPMLQEILDSEDGPLHTHLASRMALAKQLRVERVKQFYPPVRTLNLTGRGMRDEVLVFHTDQVLRAGVEFTITVDESTISPELFSLREARLKERLNSPLAILYLDERTNTLSRDKIAADLKYGNIGREGRAAQYRKLGIELVGRLWQAQPIPPPLQFWDHHAILDELEAAMATSEFLSASEPLQKGFFDYWNLLRQQLQTQADAQQAAVNSQMEQSAIAQATQQAAAQAAAAATEAATAQLQAQTEAATTPPTLLDTVASLLGGDTTPTQ